MNYRIFLFLAIALLFAGCTSVYQKGMNEFERAAYNNAIPLFKQYLEKKPQQRSELNYWIGESYRRSNRLAEALPYYEIAVKGIDSLEKAHADTLLFYYAYALKSDGRYDEAFAQFESYAQIGGAPKLRRLAEKEAQSVDKIKEIMQHQTYVSVELCPAINTATSDFAPVYWNDKLVFSSARRAEKVFETTGDGYHDLYVMTFSDEKTCQGSIASLSSVINLEGRHEATATFSPDGKTMIFARSAPEKTDREENEVNLFISEWQEGAWSEPRFLEYVNSSSWDGTPMLSQDGNTLYFASNRSGGMGGLDLYKATRDETGVFGGVTPLGTDINTEGNEMFPYEAPDGKFIFASDGHPGLGGLDIFIREEREGKMTIYNAGMPINSTQDDFALVFKDQDMREGFFTSNRKKDTMGDDDIFRFFSDSTDMRVVKYYLRGNVLGDDAISRQRTALQGVNLTLKDAKNNLWAKVQTNEKGEFLFDTMLTMGPQYVIHLEKENYFTRSEDNTFITKGREIPKEELTQMQTIVYFDTTFIMQKDIFTASGPEAPEIEILYDFDKATLRPESKERLDEFYAFLVEYMETHPQVKIELGSHTDERGNANYNQRLSQRRAQSAVDYLIEKGVEKNKIIAKGYGKSTPKIRNAKTDEEHQANRRTTIRTLLSK
ncbi:MAG: PD40 domain-containing protein [Bernardetiaceae bacterium]|nr:PD40 domain-containing protein [Bernardetiaceae bacterium]